MNLSDINTCFPAKIVSFDAEKQTAKVKLCIESYYDTVEEISRRLEPSTILSVPVHFPQCGTYALTFPIQAGDDCLVLFAQRGYDHWLYDNKTEAGLAHDGLTLPQHNRMFAETDALAIVGFNPIPEAIPNFSTSNVELRNTARTQFVSLQPSGNMEVTTPATLTINASNVIVNASSATINAPDTTINGETTINGNTAINGTLTVSDRATLQGGFTSGGALQSADPSIVTGGLLIDGIPFGTHIHTAQGEFADTTPPK